MGTLTKVSRIVIHLETRNLVTNTEITFLFHLLTILITNTKLDVLQLTLL